jgi:hypothetical protein
MKNHVSTHDLRAELARARQRIADLEHELADSEAECNHWYAECQKLKADVAFFRQPARDREHCSECGKPRDQHCPDCGATFPE